MCRAEPVSYLILPSLVSWAPCTSWGVADGPLFHMYHSTVAASETQAGLENVMRKGFEALVPGGEYHVVGETVSAEKDGELGPAMWGLHEALFGSLGRAHSEKEVITYLQNAGFVDVEVNEFIPGSLSRITGYKPA